MNKSLDCILIALNLDNNNCNVFFKIIIQAYYNLNNILRISGYTDYIIKTMNLLLNKKYNTKPLELTNINPNINENIYSIICVKWGKKYNNEYVNKLYRAIKRNLTKPFQFILFTDDNTGIDSNIQIEELSNEIDGWWNKTQIFNFNNMTERCIYFDLDTVICGNIDFVFINIIS